MGSIPIGLARSILAEYLQLYLTDADEFHSGCLALAAWSLDDVELLNRKTAMELLITTSLMLGVPLTINFAGEDHKFRALVDGHELAADDMGSMLEQAVGAMVEALERQSA